MWPGNHKNLWSNCLFVYSFGVHSEAHHHHHEVCCFGKFTFPAKHPRVALQLWTTRGCRHSRSFLCNTSVCCANRWGAFHLGASCVAAISRQCGATCTSWNGLPCLFASVFHMVASMTSGSVLRDMSQFWKTENLSFHSAFASRQVTMWIFFQLMCCIWSICQFGVACAFSCISRWQRSLAHILISSSVCFVSCFSLLCLQLLNLRPVRRLCQICFLCPNDQWHLFQNSGFALFLSTCD